MGQGQPTKSPFVISAVQLPEEVNTVYDVIILMHAVTWVNTAGCTIPDFKSKSWILCSNAMQFP